MKLPLKATAAGLLLGIILTFLLGPELDTTPGVALLLIICVLAANCIAWAAQALLGRGT